MKLTPIGKILILILAVGLAVGGWKYWQSHGGQIPLVPGMHANAGGSAGGAAIPMWYGRSLKDWLEGASDTFNKQHNGKFHVTLEYKASRDGKNGILYAGGGQPVIWNPGDSYWVEKLTHDLANPRVKGRSGARAGATETITSTRLVFVMWDDRARVFKAAMQQPRYQQKTWQLLGDIATKGWKSVGGDASWGKLKLAQSNARESNSAQSILILMYTEYLRSHPDAPVTSAGFLQFMRQIEGAVGKFADTTSKALTQLQQAGKGQIDVAIVYEANAIKAFKNGNNGLQVVYPDPTITSEYPAMVVDAPWVNAAQKEGATTFINYLLSPEVQTQALQSGLRPALPELQSKVAEFFNQSSLQQAGIQLDTHLLLDRVSQSDIDSLLYTWTKNYDPSAL